MAPASDKFYAECERQVGPWVLLTFRWHGDARIYVERLTNRPKAVINVWNAATDGPTIFCTQDAFEAKVDDWIANYDHGQGAAALTHEVLNRWS